MQQRLEEYLLAVIAGEKRGVLARLVLLLLSCLAQLFKLLLQLRVQLYELGIKSSTRLPCTVISIGNLTVGGTGKTPVAKFLAQRLQQAGLDVAVLNRGYKAEFSGEMGVVSDGEQVLLSATEAGDEAYMLAQSLSGVPVLVGSERAVTGKYAYQQFGVDVVLLDDGFQHWAVERDCDLVVIDATNPFANGHLMPRGRLREPLTNLARADYFCLTKTDQVSKQQIQEIRAQLRAYNQQAEIMETTHRPTYLRALTEEKRELLTNQQPLADTRVVALSGIGNPSSFEVTLEDLGAEVVSKARFADHHYYSKEELSEVISSADDLGADLIITTEKDAVSISPELQTWLAESEIELQVLGIELEVVSNKDTVEAILAEVEGRE